jgi:hypothetical protein
MDRKLIGQELRSLRWKSKAWTPYMNDEIKYWLFKEETRLIVNIVRACCGEPRLTQEKFDEAWQFMTVGDESYRRAYSELIRIIMLDY